MFRRALEYFIVFYKAIARELIPENEGDRVRGKWEGKSGKWRREHFTRASSVIDGFVDDKNHVQNSGFRYAHGRSCKQFLARAVQPGS